MFDHLASECLVIEKPNTWTFEHRKLELPNTEIRDFEIQEIEQTIKHWGNHDQFGNLGEAVGRTQGNQSGRGT